MSKAVLTPLGSLSHPGYFENRIPLKPALGRACSLANYIVAYEGTFRDLVCSLFPRAILLDFYFTIGAFRMSLPAKPSLLQNEVQILSAKKGKRKVQGVPQSQTAALPRHQEEEETDKTKQAQMEQTYEKHQD